MAEHSLPQTTKVWQFDQYLLAIAWTLQLLRQQPGVTAAQVAVLEDLVNTALKPCKMHKKWIVDLFLHTTNLCFLHVTAGIPPVTYF